MLFHVVQQGEKIEDIAKVYDITLEELREFNQHISDLKSVIPGMKLRIPNYSVESISEIEEITPFVEDYYPTYKDEIITNSGIDESNVINNDKLSENNYQEDNLISDNVAEPIPIAKPIPAIPVQGQTNYVNQTNIPANAYISYVVPENMRQNGYGYYTFYGLPAYPANYLTAQAPLISSYNAAQVQYYQPMQYNTQMQQQAPYTDQSYYTYPAQAQPIYYSQQNQTTQSAENENNIRPDGPSSETEE